MRPAEDRLAPHRGAQLGNNAEGACLSGEQGASTGKSEERGAGIDVDARERKNARERERYWQRKSRRRNAFLGLSWGATYLLHRLVHEGPVYLADCKATDWSRHSLVQRGFAVLDSDGYMRATRDGKLAAERRW